MNRPTVISQILELADLLRPQWPARHAAIPASDPRNEDPPAGDPPAGDPPAGDPPAGDPPADEYVAPTKDQWEKIQRENRRLADDAKALKDKEAERKRKADEEAGNHKQIAADEKARADAAEARATELEQQATDRERDARIATIAARLKYRDPSDVLPAIRKKLSDDDLDNDTKVEKALKDHAKEKPYLVTDGETPRTRDVTGDRDGGDGGKKVEPTGQDRLSRAYAQPSSK